MKINKSAESQESPKVPASYFVLFFFGLFLIFGFIFVGFGYYKNHWRSGLPRSIAKVLPLPAAIIENAGMVKYTNVIEYAALYQSGGGQEDAFEIGLQKAIESKILFNLADELNVQVSKQDLENYEVDSKDLDSLQEIGWNESQYKKYVILPFLTAQKLENAVHGDRAYQKDALQKVESVQNQIERGIDFNDLAMQYSEGVSADDGGFKGFYKIDKLPEGFEVLSSEQVGGAPKMIELENSFVLARLFDETEIEGERVEVGIEEIVVKKDDLSAVLDDLVQQAVVKYWVK